jgi:hypothetical protein
MFCDKYCIRSDKYVFIVIKIKYMNSGNINDICYKLKFTTSYTYFTIKNTNFIKTHINIIILNTFDGTVRYGV